MSRPFAPGATRAADAILAAVLPVSARTVLVAADVDTSLASNEDRPPDVEVLRRVQDAQARLAPVTICVVDAHDAGLDTGTGGRVAVRMRDHGRARLGASQARRRLAGAGYRRIETVYWDRGQAAQLPGTSSASTRLRPAERLPRRAVVSGHPAGSREPSILGAAAAAGLGRTDRRPLVRSGTLVVVDDHLVLRTALGAGCERLVRAADSLTKVAPALPRATLVPRVEGSAEIGIGRWTTETRLPGSPLRAAEIPQLEDEVIDLLVALRHAGGPPTVPLDALADAVVRALGPGVRSDGVLAAAALAAQATRGIGTSFNHGDFWHGNLLVRDGHLTGVIDWDSGDSGRLPFLDAIHFVVAGRVPRGSRRWGAEVATELARPVPSPFVARYADAIDEPLDDRRARGLVLAYWIDRLAFQITTYGDRTHRPRWLEQNIDVVVSAVEHLVG